MIASRRNKVVGPKRWKYLGLLEYLRHYADTQLDADGMVRKVWLFEFKIHQEQKVLPLGSKRPFRAKCLWHRDSWSLKIPTMTISSTR
ncbi:MAG: hypothetical protein M3Z36_09655, partial [Acidobacteriota bacterium]|nr:hypothetical protein [Acidobacteriota bacterium]